MGKWLDEFKNNPPKCGGQQTDIADIGKEKQPLDSRREGMKARELLKKQGWVAIKSHALDGEIVLWVLNGKIVIPARWQSNVRYTMDEIAALVADGGVTEEGLRRVHEAKRIFSGTVCRAKEP